MNDSRGEKLFTFNRGEDVYEIFQESDVLCAGYFNGVRSVTSNRVDLVSRGLIRKHVTGLPKGVLVNFKEAAARLGAR